MFELLGYVASILIGISLGLVGGGGSTLAVPVLVYLLHVEPVLATSYSLFIIGSTSLIGSGQYAIKKLVNFKVALIFGLPSIVTVYVTRAFILPAIPAVVPLWGEFELTKATLIMVLFAGLMLFASVSMIRKSTKEPTPSKESMGLKTVLVVLLEGLVVGLLTGLVGAGGGFLIIPALVVFAGLPMKEAVGTSLLIISAKSLIGFLGDIENLSIDWTLMLTVSGLAIVGIGIGSFLSTKIDGKKLKTGFGWLILLMGIFILYSELK
ncbi:MAG: sulfite exporter TauE/SafE family protein [Salibacteraceae bacterium]